MSEDFLDNLVTERTNTVEGAIRSCASFGNQYMDMGMEVDAASEGLDDSHHSRHKLKACGRVQEFQKERDSLKEEIRILEDARDIDTYEVVQALSFCFNLRKQYESMAEDKQRELLLLCFRDITAYRKNKGSGRRKKSEITGGRLDFIWDEPFNTIDLINWEEMAYISKENPSKKRIFTIEKEMGTSLFP